MLKIKSVFLVVMMCSFMASFVTAGWQDLTQASQEFVQDERWEKLTRQQQTILLDIIAGKDDAAVNALRQNQGDYKALAAQYDLLSIVYEHCSVQLAFNYLLLQGVSISSRVAKRLILDSHLSTFTMCLELGLDPNFRLENGDTLLMFATKNCFRYSSLEIIKILMQHGADPKLTNNNGKNAYDFCKEYVMNSSNTYCIAKIVKLFYDKNIPNEIKTIIKYRKIEEIAGPAIFFILTIAALCGTCYFFQSKSYDSK